MICEFHEGSRKHTVKFPALSGIRDADLIDRRKLQDSGIIQNKDKSQIHSSRKYKLSCLMVQQTNPPFTVSINR